MAYSDYVGLALIMVGLAVFVAVYNWRRPASRVQRVRRTSLHDRGSGSSGSSSDSGASFWSGSDGGSSCGDSGSSGGCD